MNLLKKVMPCKNRLPSIKQFIFQCLIQTAEFDFKNFKETEKGIVISCIFLGE